MGACPEKNLGGSYPIFFQVHALKNLWWPPQNHFSGCRLKECVTTVLLFFLYCVFVMCFWKKKVGRYNSTKSINATLGDVEVTFIWRYLGIMINRLFYSLVFFSNCVCLFVGVFKTLFCLFCFCRSYDLVFFYSAFSDRKFWRSRPNVSFSSY